MTHISDISFTEGLLWSVAVGLVIWSFFIYFGIKATRTGGAHLIIKSVLSALAISVVNGLLYPISTSRISPLGLLVVALVSYSLIKLVFNVSYRQAALIFMFSGFAQIITVGIIPLIESTKNRFTVNF